MKTRRITFKAAIAAVREKRNVRPNLGFERQLKQYEKEIMAASDVHHHTKVVSAKHPEQRRTEYNSIQNSHFGRVLNDYLKQHQEPRTAEGQSRRIGVSRRFPFLYS
jgi:hypothetical protein